MIQHVNAIYDHGVFRPLTPLDLKDQDQVVLTVELAENPADAGGKTEPTLYEVLDEAGLIGIIKGAPADLSTNPQHFEGFGKSGK